LPDQVGILDGRCGFGRDARASSGPAA